MDFNTSYSAWIMPDLLMKEIVIICYIIQTIGPCIGGIYGGALYITRAPTV